MSYRVFYYTVCDFPGCDERTEVGKEVSGWELYDVDVDACPTHNTPAFVEFGRQKAAWETKQKLDLENFKGEWLLLNPCPEARF